MKKLTLKSANAEIAGLNSMIANLNKRIEGLHQQLELQQKDREVLVKMSHDRTRSHVESEKAMHAERVAFRKEMATLRKVIADLLDLLAPSSRESAWKSTVGDGVWQSLFDRTLDSVTPRIAFDASKHKPDDNG